MRRYCSLLDKQAETQCYIRSYRATFEQKQQLQKLLIDRAVVTMEDVEIRYVIPVATYSEHIRFCHLVRPVSPSATR
jgi:hypothetical protein